MRGRRVLAELVIRGFLPSSEAIRLDCTSRIPKSALERVVSDFELKIAISSVIEYQNRTRGNNWSFP
jgi:hypothetical protein